MDGFFVLHIYRQVLTMDEITTIDSRKVGRPCKYESHVKPYLDDIYDWISQGMTEKSIYGKLSISHQAWIEYKDKYTELAETITRARQAAGQLLLNKQFAAGCGQKVTVRRQKPLKDGTIVEFEEEQYIPPNVQAAEFWARHMMPDYVPPKQADTTKNINVNFQLADWEQQRREILAEIKRLELQSAVDGESIPLDDDSAK